jgi:CheY-like chemotaxis protein
MPDAMPLECVGGPLDGERVLDHGLAWHVVTKSCSGVYVKQEDHYVWRPAWRRPKEAGRVEILVVDDELGVRRLVCRMLAQGGYGTCEAADGAEALASLRAGLPVDLVLSDVAMPQLNGVQLLEALSVSHPDLPVLLMSGYAVEDLVARGIAAPCGIVMKPLTPERLLDAVRRCLSEWSGRSAG